MAPNNDYIIEKIQKLQALAENAGTEHEAALAAERVAELCRQHNLDIGVARLEREETSATESVRDMGSQVWQAHWNSLTQACVKMFGVGVYKKPVYEVEKVDGIVTGGKRQVATVFYGLKASVASATVTYNYLLASVEAMLEGWLKTDGYWSTGASDRRSFRIGCARRIYDEAAKLHGARVQIQSGESMALLRLEGQLITQHAKLMKLHKGPRSAGAASRDAYGAGYAAGGKVDIHGARTSRMLA